MTSQHHFFMQQTLELAATVDPGELPVAALIAQEDQVIARAVNTRQADQDIVGHAEINALRKAAQVNQDWHLNNATIYINLEPCPMCAGAILQARIQTIVFGAYDSKTGALGSRYNIVNKNTEVIGGVLEDQSLQLLKKFFSQLRSS